MAGHQEGQCRAIGITLLGLVSLALATDAHAVGRLVSAADRTDMVYDLQRQMVYIANGEGIRRFNVATKTYRSPDWEPGGPDAVLRGLDLSPDGSSLVVADARFTVSNCWVYVIDPDTGASHTQYFARAGGPSGGEAGTHAVAFGSDGTCLVTSDYQGSGWVPMRRLDPATGGYTVVSDHVDMESMVCASGDGAYIGFAEAHSSWGPWGWYRMADGFLKRVDFFGTMYYNFEIGVNHDGTQYAVPTYGGTFIYDQGLNHLTTLGTYAGSQPVGVVYHPVDDIVYFAWAWTYEVRAHDTFTFAQVASYNFEHYFGHTGNHAYGNGRLRLARDGSILLSTVDGGVRYVHLYDSLAAHDQSVSTPEDAPVAIALTGSTGNGGAITYSLEAPPAHGALSGAPPNVTYTPYDDYNGSDNFSFRAHYGQAFATGTVSITVEPVNDPPVAVDDEAAGPKAKPVVIDVLANDSDIDGDELSVASVTQGSQGAVTVNADNTVTYTSTKRAKGTDTFTYTAGDGNGGEATASVTVTIESGGSGKPSKPGKPGKGPKSKLHLTGVTPVPTTAGAQVVFRLSAPATVRGAVLNAAGREVAVIAHDRACNAGLNSLVWNGRTASGLSVPSGTYLVHLQASTADGQRAQTIAVLNLAR